MEIPEQMEMGEKIENRRKDNKDKKATDKKI